MSGALSLTLPWLLPLLLTLAVRRQPGAAMVVAPLAALFAYLWGPLDTPLVLDWLLLGVHLQLDATGRLFLLFSALAWLATAGCLAWPPGRRVERGSFALFFLLAMAGNFLLILAADAVSFYLGFTMMGLSAYGMLVQHRSQRARRAARVYLQYTLVGEVALFAGILLLAAGGDSLRFADLAGRPLPAAGVALLILGFGIKVALPGLHLWLPPAYTLSPIAAAAVLSGPMMKAGLLGWLRFLPPEAAVPAYFGSALLLLGALGVALGILIGVGQRDPRTLLGYSSIAKMGLMSAVFGAGLAGVADREAVAAALVLFAMHHLLVKSALFLGVGEWQRRGPRPWVLGGVALLALTLAGLPWTGGAAAKRVLGDALAGELGLLLTLAAVGTTLLMVRLLYLLSRPLARRAGGPDAAAPAWLVLLPIALWAPFAPDRLTGDPAGLVPIAVGLALALLGYLSLRRWPVGRDGAPGAASQAVPRER